jgi:hypothetical protein
VTVTKMGFEMGSVKELEKEPEMVLEMETTMAPETAWKWECKMESRREGEMV